MFNLMGLSGWFAVTFPWIVWYISYYFNPDYLSQFHYDQVELSSSYDFIIIGAGSAGSVVASRLSEVMDWSVLLVEAGGGEDVVSDTPILAINNWNTIKDWNYTTVEQKYACRGLKGICPYPRGRMLGGSSSINFMVYVRGNRYDFDNWEAQGNDGWSYQNVLPYFLKSEDIRVESLKNSPYHATGGYLTVDNPQYILPIRSTLIDALEEMGYKRTDYNGKIQTGYAFPQLTIRDGSRCSTAKAFLSEIKYRSNIHISQRTLALKINLNQRGNRATGITLVKDGKTINVKANKEVILSAGAIDSPKILMLSGIGPKNHLKQVGIVPKLNLPVGLNLVDHSYITLSFKLNKNVTLTKRDIESLKNIMNYAVERTGPLTMVLGCNIINFFNLDKVYRQLPDTLFLISAYNSFDDEPTIGFVLTQLRPRSTGLVKLKSSNPYDDPIIDPRYYSNRDDFNHLVKGCLTVFEIVSSQAMSIYEPEIFPPGDLCKGKTGEEYCSCIITFYSTPMFHPTSSVRMARNGVVNPSLQVWGIPNLRVIDASIMPNITSGNTNAPTIMIGEKGADIIKSQWGFEDDY